MFESRKGIWTKYAAGVKKILHQPVQSSRPFIRQPETNFTPGAITQVDLAVRRTKLLPQRRPCVRPAPQLRERKLDVLARAQRIGGKVRTRTEIVGWSTASNDQAIGLFALW